MAPLPNVPAPLREHPVFVGRDVEGAIEAVTSVVNPHTVEVTGGRSGLDVRLMSSSVGAVTLAFLDWGADVRITAPDEASCFCVQLPVNGEALIDCGDQRLISSPTRPSVPTPVEPLRMDWPQGSAQLILRVDQRTVEGRLRRLIGGELRHGPIRMPLGLDLTGVVGARWRSIFELVGAEIAVRDQVAAGAVTANTHHSTIEELVTNALLLWHPNNYSDLLRAAVQPARPSYVRAAVDYIHEHLDTPLTVVELADHVGVSVRALQAGFAREVGSTPSTYIRDLRLDRLRDALLDGDPGAGVSVTDLAFRWGFTHLGRMSQTYRARFGELPSETLRRPG